MDFKKWAHAYQLQDLMNYVSDKFPQEECLL
jgi:hypothetical protein